MKTMRAYQLVDGDTIWRGDEEFILEAVGPVGGMIHGRTIGGERFAWLPDETVEVEVDDD